MVVKQLFLLWLFGRAPSLSAPLRMRGSCKAGSVVVGKHWNRHIQKMVAKIKGRGITGGGDEPVCVSKVACLSSKRGVVHMCSFAAALAVTSRF